MINTATNYRSGAELHFEGALNEHFPFGLTAGVGGYKQLTPDCGLRGHGRRIQGTRRGYWAIAKLYVQGGNAGGDSQRPMVS
jgi:hypothetical protein